MEYNFTEIEAKWQAHWAIHKTFRANNFDKKPKYYVLDMFPYPSGAGLHVGHPLGYIASDIYARYKRHQGYNLLHPMGYDAFGLPAEQYAIQTGQHPQITTEQNIIRYREQLDKIGFSFDWDRQVITSDPMFYQWTQWMFIKMFDAWYDENLQQARPISALIETFAKQGNAHVKAAHDCEVTFSGDQWTAFSEKEQQEVLLHYRLAYLAETTVNWCEALGTVLANDEVVNGRSERGGHPVVQRKMTQWSLRITAYAQRLLDGLETIDFSDSLKEVQRNWIGRSEGAEIEFKIDGMNTGVTVFTTRPDTLFGATFLVLAPEHELVGLITSREQEKPIADYLAFCATRTERERMAEVKDVTGAFTGAYAIHPISRKKLPIWISDYVLVGYGTGAIMAVPSGDQRDWDFANRFSLDIIPVIEGQDISAGADERKDGRMINSDFLNGKTVNDAIASMLDYLDFKGLGKRRVNYKLRDAVFSRQRYWGEPFPIYYCDGVPYPMREDLLPLRLPQIDQYKPTATGEPPLGRAENWKTDDGWLLELNTMPGWAGSSWYFLRYMDPNNAGVFASAEAMNYWGQVDLYVGGAEHSTGHLLYFRFWTKVLHDLGFVPFDEPVKKLINQGMILGENNEKMSKSRGNVVNPDDVIAEHGADSLRLHEMFLGPIELHKPWNTKGIDGVSRFLRKFWRLFHNEGGDLNITEIAPSPEEFKILHRCIQKVSEDMEKFSFNTSVSAMMIATNELTELKCNKREILEPLTVLLSCHAPHICEELWLLMGHTDSISNAPWPSAKEELLKDNVFNYPISFNGKTRFHLPLAVDMAKEAIEREALTHELSQKWLNGAAPKKVIVVPGRIVNIVV